MKLKTCSYIGLSKTGVSNDVFIDINESSFFTIAGANHTLYDIGTIINHLEFRSKRDKQKLQRYADCFGYDLLIDVEH